MDQGQAAIRAAAIGVPGVLLSGVLSYRAGRRQVRDQGVNEHRHWLRQQRQEYYVRFLQVLHVTLRVITAHSDAVVEAGQALESEELDSRDDDFQQLFRPSGVMRASAR